ncbi:MAG: response regulator transcription factor [Mesorhizobium sp.]|uniref:Response regulator n=3 Tax=Mesorhizobium TaxID=68287 RepID=A0AB36RIT8_9HYPH|nr:MULTISPECIES: response regulator [Mesorhizobium]PAQ03804.1 response regulator [Mesorhizobium mediterraneum]RWA98368.1 MAG: response regulator transcription factor [Mesorhizobium sp.]RWD10425.1 MAG: response regulator transcription factor [Mesorhizobium sp.]RWF66299.1 MAG: response regulator transcription factor [Mesorhizobium sp.]RWK37946.1 MAG: response regulator transcription factor [Mesorhizobium sp.]
MFRALVVEDQNLMRLALMEQIQASFSDCVVLGAETLELATRELQNDDFDLVVIDPGLPGFDPTAQADRLAVVDKIIETSPSAIHVVVTGSDSSSEADEFRRVGAAGYLGKTGLEPGVFADVLEDISTNGFSMRLSRVAMKIPDYRYSGLTPREQEIIDMMTRRERGMKRTQIYELMADRLAIDAGTAERYYKQARAKLMRRGHTLPKGL